MSEGKRSVLEGVPNALPGLIKAQRMQEKAGQVGFEWDRADQVWEKVEEELGEFRDSIQDTDPNRKTEEFGDLLFALINYARFIDVDANRALDLTNRKFKSRIEYIEKEADRPLSEMTLSEMGKSLPMILRL